MAVWFYVPFKQVKYSIERHEQINVYYMTSSGDINVINKPKKTTCST